MLSVIRHPELDSGSITINTWIPKLLILNQVQHIQYRNDVDFKNDMAVELMHCDDCPDAY